MQLSYENIALQVLELEIQGLRDLASCMNDDFSKIIETISDTKGRVVLSGMGKSGYVAKKISATLSSTGTPSIYIHPAEAAHGDLGMITQDDVVILLSNSGETPELNVIINYCKRFFIKIIGISRVHQSTLAKVSDISIILPPTPEASDIMAPTTSAIMMMAYGDAIAVALYKKHGFTAKDFRDLHPGGKIGARLLKIEDVMHRGEDIPLIGKQEIAFEAIISITSKRLGCVGIIDQDGGLIGIITDGDLRRHVDVNLHSVAVTEIMTLHPITLSKDALASEAVFLMEKKGITTIFIVDDLKRPEGIVHIHDLLRMGVV